MKKLLGIVVLGLFFSANFLAIDLKAEVVTDPDLIKELNDYLIASHSRLNSVTLTIEI